jgi:hypothetical protein
VFTKLYENGKLPLDKPKQKAQKSLYRVKEGDELKKSVLRGINKLAKGVKPEEPKPAGGKLRRQPIKQNKDETLQANLADHQKPQDFTTVKLTGSKGEVYEVAVPASYAPNIPKVWEWNAERYAVAEYIAQGIPFTQIPDQPGVNIKSRMMIYVWLEHPEFKKHVDGLVLESGWANRRERLAKLQRVNEVLLQKLVREIDGVKLTDKSLGAVLSALQAGAKLIAQDKGEFVEETKVSQETNLTAKVASVSLKVDDMIAGKTEEEKKQLEQDFDNIADDIIRSLTGER